MADDSDRLEELSMKNTLNTALERYKYAKDHWGTIYQKMQDDLDFLSDKEDAQWDAKDIQDRKQTGRPVLTIDQLGQFIRSVTNNIRMNTPTIKVIPQGDADVETAEVLQGLIRHIEYDSRADAVYDQAADFAVKGSMGFIRVDHNYEDSESFYQRLLIKGVVNPGAVFIDPDSVECDGSDAKWGFVIEPMKGKRFKEEYPKLTATSFGDETGQPCNDDDEVMIAEYFWIDETPIEIGQLPDGTVEEVKDGVPYTMTRKTMKRVVRRQLLSGADILEETVFPGEYVPIVPVYGELAWNNGERNVFSLIRKAKDAQRVYNFWRSVEMELLMKQPQSPWAAAEGTIEDYAQDWLNPDKSGVLRYKTTDLEGKPAPMPTRLPPPQIPMGIVNAARQTVDDIKSTMGIYGASLGQRTNETTGIAIAQRKAEGDVATYHFMDNLVRAIGQVGRIIVSAARVVYDTGRILTIIGEEEEQKKVGINGMTVEGQKRDFDLTKGKYDVKVITGAPFTTKRQEAAEFMTSIIEKRPELMQVAGDLLFQNMDFPGAPAMAKRIKKTIPPELLADNDEEQDPMVAQLKAALEQTQAQLQSAMMEMQTKDKELIAKQQIELKKLEIDAAKVALDREKLELERQKATAEVTLMQEELELQRAQVAIKAVNDGMTATETPDVNVGLT